MIAGKWDRFDTLAADCRRRQEARSMQPTIAKLDRLAQAEIDTDRFATSYSRGKEDGKREGRAEAYRRIRWALAAVVLIGVIAWWIG